MDEVQEAEAGEVDPRAPETEVRILVQWVRLRSGLTLNQLGRMFGVSGRKVFHWSAGSPLLPKREALVRRLAVEMADVMDGLVAKDAESVRFALLTGSPSLVGRWIRDRYSEQGPRLQYGESYL